MRLPLTLPGKRPPPPRAAPSPSQMADLARTTRAIAARLNDPSRASRPPPDTASPSSLTLPGTNPNRVDITRDDRGRIDRIGTAKLIYDEYGKAIGIEG